MMFYITMKQGITPHNKSNANHAPFKKQIVNDIDAKQRQAGHYKWKQCTVNSTG